MFVACSKTGAEEIEPNVEHANLACPKCFWIRSSMWLWSAAYDYGSYITRLHMTRDIHHSYFLQSQQSRPPDHL